MLPDKFKLKIEQMLKEDSEEFFDSYNKEHYAGLRVNTLKVTPDKLKEIAPCKLEQIPWTEKGL